MDHHDSGALLSESYSGGFLAGLAVTNVLDARLRRATNGLTLNSSFLAWTTNAYDNASRLATVGNDTFSSSYAYLAHSPLWGTLTFKQNGTTRMTTTRQYDRLNRLQQVTAQPSEAAPGAISYGYVHDDANQRTRATLADGSYWVYGYDRLGQVISGKKYWADGKGNRVRSVLLTYGMWLEQFRGMARPLRIVVAGAWTRRRSRRLNGSVDRLSVRNIGILKTGAPSGVMAREPRIDFSGRVHPR